MKKHVVRMSAALLASALLLAGSTACAEEKRLGDLIYVPAMTASDKAGRITLRVEGLALTQDSDEPVVVPSLAGAEFGVYVVSSEGELTPWANPLYPSEPMRIRSGEEPVSFTLPETAEFYLVQHSAPQGYIFDENAVIPVAGSEIVVTNSMPGELVVSAVDSLGEPISGVSMTMTAQDDGVSQVLVTDENGQAVLLQENDAVYSVSETALPEGVFGALGVSVNSAEMQQTEQAQVQIETAKRSCVTFVHPAAGSVQLNMQLSSVNDQGETVLTPLEGVVMDVESNPPVHIVTDEQGQAQASLLEGTYLIHFGYEGDQEVNLPFEAAQMLIQSGAATVIELSASEVTGRVVLTAVTEREIEGGSFTLENVYTGETFGPFMIDADGVAVSSALEVGEYRISGFEAPKNMQLDELVCGTQTVDQTGSLVVSVQPGAAAQVSAMLLSREMQQFALYKELAAETGEIAQEAIAGSFRAELVDELGNVVSGLQIENGQVTVEALSGIYTLQMEEEAAEQLGVEPVSRSFELPAQQDAIVFASGKGRLILSSVDENGMPVEGASYLIMDASGAQSIVVCDSFGEGVSSLLHAGEVRISTLSAPGEHASASEATVVLEPAQALRVSMVHESFGTARIDVRTLALDDSGRESYSPVSGAVIQLYRVSDDGQRITDTDIDLVTDENGCAEVRLEAGEYMALLDAQSKSEADEEQKSVSFAVCNTEVAQAQLTCRDAFGGVRVRMAGQEITNEMLAQIRFELVAQDRTVSDLTLLSDGSFYAGGLSEGEYVLRQTQIPQGYTPAEDRPVTVAGAQAAEVLVALEEYAVISVSKTGLTFNERLQTFVVPLEGQYGVYTMEEGEMRPYPTGQNQLTVWANASPEQIAQGRNAQLKLPAKAEGTMYYLHEIGAAKGFAADDTYYEVFVSAGEQAVISCTVSSDRGFFEFKHLDASALEPAYGGQYELVDAAGEAVLSFVMEEAVYRNDMALPVGTYTLRQIKAGEGYALSEENEIPIEIEPYLTQGGQVASASMRSVRVPDGGQMTLIQDVYAAREQGLTLISVDSSVLEAGYTLLVPQMQINLNADADVNVVSVVLGNVQDDLQTPYKARVEYCLAGGGWQPSDARMTGVLTGPTAVSLADVQDDVCAVRVTYLNAETGEEAVSDGFTPGQVTLGVRVGAQGPVNVQAEALFSGVFAYRTVRGGERLQMLRTASAEYAFEAEGDGLFETVSAGRDGKISGIVFFDDNADGILSEDETGRYAGMTVSLLGGNGETVASCRTDSAGSYQFASLSAGVYTLQFESSEEIIFSQGEFGSEHVRSGVSDVHYGASAPVQIDGDHSDYVIHAGCVYAAHLSGVIVQPDEQGEYHGVGGLSVEMHALNGSDEEPSVVMTDDLGQFRFDGILEGEYRIVLPLPHGYLSAEASDGVISRTISFKQGEDASFDEVIIVEAAGVSGRVLIDGEGDGQFGDDAQPLEGAKVVLVSVEDGRTEEIARTQTDEQGAYAFEHLYPGAYSVLFELDGEWTFTRYGGDSSVYGAVSQSGSTKAFELAAGEYAQGINAGVTIPAQLNVMVFEDSHADGEKGAYETGLEGVSVSLIRVENGEDAEAVTYVTDAEGMAVFEGVSPGEYVLAYQMPGQWRSTKQVDPLSSHYPVSCVPQSTERSGRSLPFALSMGHSGETMYIGAMLSGSISGEVFFDDDANAMHSEGEAYCPDARIELLNAQNEVLAETVPDENGAYAFDGVVPGRYRVRFTTQEDFGFSATERTMTRGGVQASTENISTTRPITLTAGSTVTTAHAGVVRLCSVSGVIWEDRSGDCLIGGDESGFSGVTVNLMDGAGRMILAVTQTDENGSFTFDHLTPDMYRLRIDAPDSYVFSGALSGGALAIESQRNRRAYSVPFTLLGGADAQGIGFGLLTQGTISGCVWEDSDYDAVMQTDSDGLRGAVLTLYDLSGNEIAQTQTMRSGEFKFSELMPGEYSISVELPEGYVFTAPDGESAVSGSDRSMDSVYVGMLQMGSSIDDIRIGALKPAAVGGVVWLDLDNDGRRQNDQNGLSGVAVELRVLSGADEGRVIVTQTDEIGSYRFDNVMPGELELGFTLEEGYAFAKKVSGSRRVSVVPMTDALHAVSDRITVKAGSSSLDQDVGVVGVGTISGRFWEDADYDGRMDDAEAGISGAQIALIDAKSGEAVGSVDADENGAYQIGFVREGEYMLQYTLPSGMIFTREGDSEIAMVDADEAVTARFEVSIGESISGMDAGAIVPAVVTGAVMLDLDENGVCGENEPGMSGVTVTLMQGGTAATTVNTHKDGSFELGWLRPGTYRVRVTLPEDALFSINSPLNLANPDAQEGETAELTLEMGQSAAIEPIAAVCGAVITGRAWLDQNVSGLMDDEEPSLTAVRAQLLSGGDVIASTDVDENGRYAFELLRSGEYAVRFTLPTGMLLADRAEGELTSSAEVVPGNVGTTRSFALAMGETKDNVNVGGILPGEIGDTVWLDSNGNGLQDYQEELIPGVTLTLTRVDADGNALQSETAVSDEYGYYHFRGLRPGSYILSVQTKVGDVLTYHFGEPLGEIDSDIVPETGMSEILLLQSGQTLRSVDVGFVEYTD